MDFARALRISRAARGVSQKELAAKAGVSASYVSLIEGGKREPTFKSLRNLSGALGVPFDLMMLLAIEETETSKVSAELLSELSKNLLEILTQSISAVAHGT